jgi:hypothetical protein
MGVRKGRWGRRKDAKRSVARSVVLMVVGLRLKGGGGDASNYVGWLAMLCSILH